MDTAGGALLAAIVTFTGVDVVVAPWLSLATAVRAYDPGAAPGH
jgi:hypothetical protein